jgi:hypothetical protein
MQMLMHMRDTSALGAQRTQGARTRTTVYHKSCKVRCGIRDGGGDVRQALFIALRGTLQEGGGGMRDVCVGRPLQCALALWTCVGYVRVARTCVRTCASSCALRALHVQRTCVAHVHVHVHLHLHLHRM